MLLDGVQASDVYGDFVYISSSGQGPTRGQPSEHVAVVRSRFACSGRQGVAITSARDVTIRGTSSPMWRDRCSISNRIPSATRCGTFASSRTRRGAAVNFWIASKGAGNQIGDVVVRRNTMRSPTGGLVFVFGGRGGARGPFVFEANRLQVTGAVTDEDAVGVSSSAIRTRSRFATIR